MNARTALGLTFTLLASSLVACTAVLDVKDLELTDGKSVDGVTQTPAPGAPQGPTSPEGGVAADGGAAPVTCEGADKKRDPKHCGRCGHDCLGGACDDGVCRAKEIATALDSPFSLTTTADHVFVATNRGGTILRVKKDGSATEPFATGQRSPWGIATGGGFVYWANNYFAADGGGVWRCPVTASPCAAPQRIVAAGHARRPTFAGGFVYFAEEDGNLVRRATPDGATVTTVANASKPFGIAVDATHVYYTSAANTFQRAPVAGGPVENLGPANGASWGLAAVDDARAYYAFGFGDGTGRVLAVDKAKPATVTEYGKPESHREPLGVAVAGGWVYWTEHGNGSFDGALRACPVAGCPASGPLELATRLDYPGDIAIDEAAVYVVSAGTFGRASGTVHRVARP
jgi:hypothetical protein